MVLGGGAASHERGSPEGAGAVAENNVIRVQGSGVCLEEVGSRAVAKHDVITEVPRS